MRDACMACDPHLHPAQRLRLSIAAPQRAPTAPQVDTNISISEYPLSAAYCLARITNAFEQKWGIV